MEYSVDVLTEPAAEDPSCRVELVGAARPLHCPGTPEALSVSAGGHIPSKKNKGFRSSFQQNPHGKTLHLPPVLSMSPGDGGLLVEVDRHRDMGVVPDQSHCRSIRPVPDAGLPKHQMSHVRGIPAAQRRGPPSPGCGTSSRTVLVGHGEDIEDGIAPKAILLENGPLPPVL